MEVNSSNSSKKSGNTKQISPAKWWCFTLNNYSKEEVDELMMVSSKFTSIAAFQEEVGENGTPHIQGCICFKKKVRPVSVFNSSRYHWEKTLARKKQDAIDYCFKEDSRIGKQYYYVKGKKTRVPVIHFISELRPFQQKVIDIIEGTPDDRTINWFWEETGNVGKSALCRLIVRDYNAIIISGKASDMKNAILQYENKNGVYPEIIVFDVPRSNLEYLSYTGIEEIKNGLFYSGKYEGGMVLMPHPHVIVFANEKPEMDGTFSFDRWNIVKVGWTPSKPAGLRPNPENIAAVLPAARIKRSGDLSKLEPKGFIKELEREFYHNQYKHDYYPERDAPSKDL